MTQDPLLDLAALCCAGTDDEQGWESEVARTLSLLRTAPGDPTLHAIRDLARKKNLADLRIDLVLAHARQGPRARRYTLESLAAAAGISPSGARLRSGGRPVIENAERMVARARRAAGTIGRQGPAIEVPAAAECRALRELDRLVLRERRLPDDHETRRVFGAH